MKTKLYILTLTILGLLFSCGLRKVKNFNAILKNDSIPMSFEQKEKIRLEKRAEIERQEKLDSLYLDIFLKEAIKIAKENVNQNIFNKEYIETMPDSSFQVEISISSDFYFSKENPHFIIRRNTPNIIYIDIFSKDSNQINKVISHEQWNMTHVGDTIKDINGDNLNDFVVNWYGSTGCCLKAFSDIYLLRPDKKTFSKNFQFINPTFSPKEKIIRGVCYGHPGETEMYKFEWKDETIDTLEYVSYELNKKGKKTGKIIISKNRAEQPEIIKLLNEVPEEYKIIEGYDWFEGYD